MDKTRTLDEVVDRALCVLATITLAHPSASREAVLGWLKRNGLDEKLSPDEQAFVAAEKPGREDVIRFSWMSERLHVLCWVLGQQEALAPLSEPGSGQFSEASFNADGSLERARVLANSVLRPLAELQEASALIAGRHAQLREKMRRRQKFPVTDAGIAQERHAAINWVLCHEDLDWDDLCTED